MFPRAKSILLIACLALILTMSTISSAQTRGMQLGSWGRTQEQLVQDIVDLNGLGADIVRFPVYFGYDTSVDNWLVVVKACVEKAKELKMTLVVDFHNITLGTSTHVESHTDAPPIMVCTESDFRKRWRQFAIALKGKRNVWFDIMNEPEQNYVAGPWVTVASHAIETIRAQDASRKVVVAVPGTRNKEKGIKITYIDSFMPPSVDNMVVEVHAYDWDKKQKEVFARYPDEAGFNRATIKKLIGKIVTFRKRFKVPVYIGEVAIRSYREDYDPATGMTTIVPNPYAATFFDNFLNEASSKGIPVTIHAFREDQTWNYELNTTAWDKITAWLKETSNP